MHVDTFGFYPSAGWHWAWAGDPDLGTGKSQPGPWTYSILPFLEASALYEMGSDGDPNNITAEQRRGTRDRLVQPIGTFHCPSRRTARLYPGWATYTEPTSQPVNSLQVTDDQIAKTDYAINGGSNIMNCPWPQPPSRSNLTQEWVPDCPTGDRGIRGNGPSYFRSQVSIKKVTDGTTKTFLIGEKFLEPSRYDFVSQGDHHGLHVYYWDTFRLAGGFHAGRRYNQMELDRLLPLQDADLGNPNVVKETGDCCTHRFGSAHPGAFHMTMCDGSVHAVPYSIDPLVYDKLGNREDGLVLDEIPF